MAGRVADVLGVGEELYEAFVSLTFSFVVGLLEVGNGHGSGGAGVRSRSFGHEAFGEGNK